MTRTRHQQTSTLCIFSNFKQTSIQIDKSLERNRKLRNQDFVTSTGTATNDYELFYNFQKIFFDNEYFLSYAKLISFMINLHMLSYGVQIGLIAITLSLPLLVHNISKWSDTLKKIFKV